MDDEGSPAPRAGAGDSGLKKGPKRAPPKTPLQKEVLEASFQLNPSPAEEHRRALGERIGLDEKQVQAWYVGRRRRDKRTEEAKAVTASFASSASPGPTGTHTPAHTGTPAQRLSPPPMALDTSPAPPVPQPPAPVHVLHPPNPVLAPPQHHLPVLAPPPPAFLPAPLPSAFLSTPLPSATTGQASSSTYPQTSTIPSMGGHVPGLLAPQLHLFPQQQPLVFEGAGMQMHPHHMNVITTGPPLPPSLAPPLTAQLTATPASAEALQDYQQLVEGAKSTLDAPYREDGPPLGAVFDSEPLGGAMGKRKRSALEIGWEGQQMPGMGGIDMDMGGLPAVSAVPAPPVRPFSTKGLTRAERDKLRQAEEVAREAERAERERRKVADKIQREQQKEEVKRLRELEKTVLAKAREQKKVELQRDKERKAEEKRREKGGARGPAVPGAVRSHKGAVHAGPPDDEDIEWEALVEAQRVSAGLPAREATPAPGEDGYAATPGTSQLPPPVRPEFPPPTLDLTPAFEGWLEEEGLGPDVLMVTSFLHCFSDVLGLRPPPTADEMALALQQGSQSLLLGAVHTGMLRLIQADMEESHASGALASVGGAGTLVDRAAVVAAHHMEAAWGWGFDVDTWRAHISPLTWPEVLRQVGVALTLVPEKKTPRRNPRPGMPAHKLKVGDLGEDIFEDTSGAMKLRLPKRYTLGTVKSCAWQCLAEAGPKGLIIAEIAKTIQESGMRDLRTSRTPDASIAGALSRDVLFVRLAPGVFALSAVLSNLKRLGYPEATAPATASATVPQTGPTATPSTSVKQEGGPVDPTPAVKSDTNGDVVMGGAEGGKTPEGKALKQEGKVGEATPMQVDGAPTSQSAAGEEEGAGEEDFEDEEYEEEGEGKEGSEAGAEGAEAGAVAPGVGGMWSREPWVSALAARDYDSLSIRERLEALSWLVHSTADGPTARLVLEARQEDLFNIKKRLNEEARLEKKKRQEDSQAKQRLAAEEASRRLQELQAEGGALQGGGYEGAEGTCDPERVARMAMEAAAVAAQRQAVAVAAASIAGAGAEDPEEEKAARIRRQIALARVDDDHALRIEPLGLDRRHNRYLVVAGGPVPGSGLAGCPSGTVSQRGFGDPGAGRVYVEAGDGSSWRLLSKPHQLDKLVAALDVRGSREASLAGGISQHGATIRRSMPGTPLTPAPHGSTPSDWAVQLTGRCLQAHHNFSSFDSFNPTLPTCPSDSMFARKLKSDMVAVLAALPPAALVYDFDRGAWLGRVAAGTTPISLRRCLGALEAAIAPGALSTAFSRNPDIRRAAWSSLARQEVEAAEVEEESAHSTLLEPLAWLPPTYPAMALRLAALDAALYYKQPNRCGRDRMIGYRYTVRPGPLLRPSDGVDEDSSCLTRPLASFMATHNGGITLALGASLLHSGKARLALMFPLIPLHIMSGAPQEFILPVDEFRSDVAQAVGQGTLYPRLDSMLPMGMMHVSHVRGQGVRGPGGPRSNHQEIDAEDDPLTPTQRARVQAMKQASSAVRSLFARITQARAGRGTGAAAAGAGKAAKGGAATAARGARKPSRLSNAATKVSQEGVEGADADYGADYDDGFEEMLEDGGAGLYVPGSVPGVGAHHPRMSEDGAGLLLGFDDE